MNRPELVVVGRIESPRGYVFLDCAKRPNCQWDAHWEFPGGKVEFGEQPEQALRRELLEEFGLVIEPLRLLPTILSHVIEYTDRLPGHYVVLCYECLSTTEDVTPDGKSSYSHGWFAPNRLPTPTITNVELWMDEAVLR